MCFSDIPFLSEVSEPGSLATICHGFYFHCTALIAKLFISERFSQKKPHNCLAVIAWGVSLCCWEEFIERTLVSFPLVQWNENPWPADSCVMCGSHVFIVWVWAIRTNDSSVTSWQWDGTYMRSTAESMLTITDIFLSAEWNFLELTDYNIIWNFFFFCNFITLLFIG